MPSDKTLENLRAHAISNSFFAPTTLGKAMQRLAFVQADPIRSPARAQDLILRHRVTGYRAGDLERRYHAMEIEEDVLYAYGFMPREVWRLLHPRKYVPLSPLEQKVHNVVCKHGRMHPAELEAHFGRQRVVNAWGGHSKATTHALDHLQYRGLLRVAGRENGIRLYEACHPSTLVNEQSAIERLRMLILTVAGIFAPVPEKTLRATIARFRHLGHPPAVLEELVRSGKLERKHASGMAYISPLTREKISNDRPQRVRFLAPFDPLVWDRRRFEHLWHWAYRFEAYTPAKKRIRGYYAMPLLWGDGVIGWANASVVKGQLNVKVGFVESWPREPKFRDELDAEIERMKAFLGLTAK